MCAQCIRHPINGSVFALSLSCFFWLLSGRCWNSDRRNLLVLVKSQVYERLYYFSAARGRALCIFLSCRREPKWSIFIQISQSLHFFLSMPVRSAAVWFASLVRFKTMSCFRSPALNAGHGFTFFRCDTFSWKTFYFYISSFSDCRSSDCIWKRRHRSVPVVCVLCCESVPSFSLTASVWDWCFRR